MYGFFVYYLYVCIIYMHRKWVSISVSVLLKYILAFFLTFKPEIVWCLSKCGTAFFIHKDEWLEKTALDVAG